MDVELLHFETPDMTDIKAGLGLFNKVVAGHDFDFVPSLQERLSVASLILNSNSRAVVDQARLLEVALDSLGLEEIVAHWLKIQQGAPVDVLAQQAALEDVKALYLDKINRLINKAYIVKAAIYKSVAEGEALNLEHYSDPLMIYDADRLAYLDNLQTQYLSEFDQLTADKKVLEAAIDILGSKTWLDHFKRLLPTADQISTLLTAAAVGKVDADIISLALERMSLYLDVFSEGMEISKLYESLFKITEKKARVQEQIKGNKQEISGLQRRAQKMASHSELVSAKARWVENLTRVLESFDHFLTGRETMLAVTDDAMQHTFAWLQQLKAYLRAIKL